MKKKTAIYVFSGIVLVILITTLLWYFALRSTTAQVKEIPTKEGDTNVIALDCEDAQEGQASSYEEAIYVIYQMYNFEIINQTNEFLKKIKDGRKVLDEYEYILENQFDSNYRVIYDNILELPECERKFVQGVLYAKTIELYTTVYGIEEVALGLTKGWKPSGDLDYDSISEMLKNTGHSISVNPVDGREDEDTSIPKGDSVLSKPTSMASLDGVLYVVDSDDNQLWQIDPNNTEDRNLLGSLPARSIDIASHAGFLYMVSYKEYIKLWQINLSEPESSTSIGELPLSEIPTSITSHNGILYLSDGMNFEGYSSSALWQINLSDLANSTNVGRFPVYSDELISHNGVLYIKSGRQLWQINPSDTGDRNVVGRFPDEWLGDLFGIRDIVFHNEALYRLTTKDDSSFEVMQINLDDLEKTSVIIGDLPEGLSEPDAMVSLDGVLYIVDEDDDQLWQVNTDEPKNSRIVGSLPVSVRSSAIASYNGSLYVLGSGESFDGAKLLQLDLNNLENITEVGDLPALGPISFINEYLYIAGYSDEKLWRVNINDLGNGTIIGDVPVTWWINYGGTMTSHNEDLYILGAGPGRRLQKINLNNLGEGTFLKGLPSTGSDVIASHNGDFYTVTYENKLWKVELEE